MKQIECKILYNCKRGDHLSQVFTGFTLLHRADIIKMSQKSANVIRPDRTGLSSPWCFRESCLFVIVNRNIKLYYDIHDSTYIDEGAAREVDYYFKRSYLPSAIPENFRKKIFPFGLNYPLYSAEFDLFDAQRVFLLRENLPTKCFEAARFLKRTFANVFPRVFFTPTSNNIFAEPDYLLKPQVLFMAYAWSPQFVPPVSEEYMEQIMQMNKLRARCIELLRKEFGPAFVGGFMHTAYAIKNFKHLLCDDKKSEQKKNYINMLKRFPICVATKGLGGSVSWKIGEYAAFAKAIVSERIEHVIPGDFHAPKNYLEFESAEQCVAQARKLFVDKNLRNKMMAANHLYYISYLRPDVLILRTLKIALQLQT